MKAVFAMLLSVIAGCDSATGPGGAGEYIRELVAVTHGADQFVAVGFRIGVEGGVTMAGSDSVLVYTSATGAEWTEVGVRVPGALRSVAYGGGVWVAVGAGIDERSEGLIMNSSNGTTWGRADGPNLRWSSVAYQHDRFVAVGYDREGWAYPAVSPDGMTWQVGVRTGMLSPRLTAGGDVVALWGEAEWLAVSMDGVEWEVADFSPLNRVSALEYRDGHWTGFGVYDCCFGEQPERVAYFQLSSTDGREWQRTPVEDETLITDLASSEDVWVAIAEQGVVHSSEPANWQLAEGNPGVGRPALDVTRGEGRFVAVGRETVWWSEHGAEWEAVTLR